MKMCVVGVGEVAKCRIGSNTDRSVGGGGG